MTTRTGIVAAGLLAVLCTGLTSTATATNTGEVVSYVEAGQLRLIDPATGVDTLSTELPAAFSDFAALAWSPDANWLALTKRTSTDRKAVLFNPVAAAQPQVVSLPRAARPLGWNRASSSFQFRLGCTVYSLKPGATATTQIQFAGKCADNGTAGFYGSTSDGSNNTDRRVISPDGRWSAQLDGKDIVMRRPGSTVRRLQLQNFAGFPAESASRYAFFIIRWLPDSRSVVVSFTHSPQGLDIPGPWLHWIVAATGGSEQLLGLRWWLPSAFAWDGNRMAVVGGSRVKDGKRVPTWKLAVYQLATGDRDDRPAWNEHFYWIGSTAGISPSGSLVTVDNNVPPDVPNPDNALWVSASSAPNWRRLVKGYFQRVYLWRPAPWASSVTERRGVC